MMKMFYSLVIRQAQWNITLQDHTNIILNLFKYLNTFKYLVGKIFSLQNIPDLLRDVDT